MGVSPRHPPPSSAGGQAPRSLGVRLLEVACERIGLRRLDDGTGAHGNYRRSALVVERDGGESVPDFDAIEPAADASDAEAERGNGFDLPAPNPFD